MCAVVSIRVRSSVLQETLDRVTGHKNAYFIYLHLRSEHADGKVTLA